MFINFFCVSVRLSVALLGTTFLYIFLQDKRCWQRNTYTMQNPIIETVIKSVQVFYRPKVSSEMASWYRIEGRYTLYLPVDWYDLVKKFLSMKNLRLFFKADCTLIVIKMYARALVCVGGCVCVRVWVWV